MTEESAVKVCVRVRPLIAREESDGSENAQPVQLYWKADKKSIHQIDDGTSTKSFSFDRVFTADETTNQLYQDIAKPLVVSTVEGYNGTIFAYGQTSSGKTFSMMGSDRIPGVIPLAVEDVFQTIKNCPKKEFLLRVSYMEIYNETVTDLLVDSWKRKPLEVRETINKNIYVADLTEELVTSPAQALAWIRKGEKNRHYGKTKMNERSSRSHTIFRMILESRERSDPASGENADGAIFVSHLNLVDLAGSERASQTGAEGTRFKEGCNINRSLFTLGQVIKKLTDEGQKGFTNYRDSKLTRILQNSLGGNAKTVIICTITPVALDETLSTLQFASTAKKMKNDPHVTEVSDDGALLKRYRNEIVDLKRRLHEVSSITQTTATEKEVLSHLLQEKDQLQREQQDRIKNLTKLLVTSSNSVPVQKVPKRRVTWGGKMLKLARLSACDEGSSESFTRKRKVDRSCLMELGEDEEDFDSQWEIPDEPSDEMEMSQSSVTVRSFEDSPKDFVPSDRMRELSGKVSSLELQLQTETEQKLEAMEKVEMLEVRVADMDRRLDEQSHTRSETDQQMRKQFAETIQLCETLASEKDVVVAERDYLKQELGMFIEQTESLEKEKVSLSQELEEKRETDEFKSLEEEFRKEHENELLNEISSLKAAVESSELRCLELQIKLETLSEELKKKSEFAEELQSMSGKDLVQEVAKLRRSLDDAEGLSRDTKKEWAVLRSQNMALKETNDTLTADHGKMEAEVNSLSFQLEMEKSRNRKVQSDLQKELNVAFDENTKLTTLLDGKVPRNLIDSVELERTVADLNKELTASREAEAALAAQLEEVASLRALPDEVDNLKKQAGKTKVLLQSLQDELQEQRQKNLDLVKLYEQKESDMQSLSQELHSVQDEKETLLMAAGQSSAEEMEKVLSTLASLTAERDQLKMDLEENVEMMIENQEELRTALEKNREQKKQIQQLETAPTSRQHGETSAQLEELQTHMNTLTEELESARAERDGLLSERETGCRTSTEELLRRVTSLSEERDQLQETLEGLRQEKQQLEDTMGTLQTEMRTVTEKRESVEAERDRLLSERETSCRTSTEETEELLRRVTSLSEERDQLQETLEGLRQEKQQLRAQLEDTMEMVAQAQHGFNQPERLSCELQAHSEEVTQLQQKIEQLQASLQAVSEQKSHLEDDAQRNMEMATETQSLLQSLQQQLQEQNQRNVDLERLNQERQAQLEQEAAETQCLLSSLQEDLQEQKLKSSDHMKLCEQRESDLEQQTKTLTEELESARAERDTLFFEKETGCRTSTEELLRRVTSLGEERDQLQETLEGLRQEKQQLRAQLEDRMEMMQCEFQQQQLGSEPHSLKEEQEAQLLLQIQQLEGHLDKAKEEVSQLKSDLQENVELMIENQEELTASQEKIRVLQDEISVLRTQKTELEARPSDGGDAESTSQLQELKNQAGLHILRLTEKLESVELERDGLFSEREIGCRTSTEETEELLRRVTSLGEERDQLQETLEGLIQEKQQLEDTMGTLQTEIAELKTSLQTVTEHKRQLEDDLQQSVDMASATQELLKSVQEELCEKKQTNSDLQRLGQERECSLDQQMRTLTEKLESVEAERDRLLSERETGCRASTEETEELLRRVTSLSEERDQQQETLEGLIQEKQQLRAQLEDTMEMISAVQEKLSEQEQLNVQLQAEIGERDAKLQQQVQQLEEQLQVCRERLTRAEGQAGTSQQLLSDANTTISALREQLSSSAVRETASTRLQDSTGQLQESFRRFQHFIDTCSKYNSTPPHMTLRLQGSLDSSYLPSLPRPTIKAYCRVGELGLKAVQTMGMGMAYLQLQGQVYKKKFEQLVEKDLALFEERRLQDVLLCRAQAPSYSIKDDDLATLWEHRLTDVLDKRQLYLQKMPSILEKLWASIASYPSELSAEFQERERFKEQMQGVVTDQPVCFSRMDSILSCELERRSAVARSREAILQGITDEHGDLYKELKRLEDRADFQLRDERSKTATLLQALKGAPLKTEVSLLEDNRRLVLQLQQNEERVKALCVQNEHLEDAQVKANNRVSNHKQATQLLQTELQDSRAHVEEKEKTIQTLTSKLRESEKKGPSSAVELEKLRTQMFKMEVELSSASDKHQQEIQRMSALLNEKEESLRKLKETLRKSQQQGDESFLQGEDLHARLTDPRGLIIKSSVLLEKTKLEQEVKELQLKISQLESMLSGQQAEISKWKSRAIKLKVKSKAEVDHLSPASTPTKRGLPSDSSNFFSSPKKFLVIPKKALDSPRKALDSPGKVSGSPRKPLDSPKVSLLDSPKSRFFDVDGSSELLSRTCPKQFFDNSSLGTIPAVSQVPDPPAAETDADRKEEWWPQSPKQEDMCRTQ